MSIITVNPHKCTCVNGKQYVYIASNSIICAIDERIAQMLKYDGKSYDVALIEYCSKFCTNKSEFDTNIEKMKAVRLITLECSKEDIEEDYGLSSVMLVLTRDCNLSCKYCYERVQNSKADVAMTKNTAFSAIDFTFNNAKSQTITIAFFGGEPLLCFDLIKDVVEYSNVLANKYHKKVKYAMTTNATLVTDKLASFFESNNFMLTVSLDGSKEQHDKYRQYMDASGSYNDTLAGIERLKNVKDMIIRGTMSDVDYSFFEAINSVLNRTQRRFFISESNAIFVPENVEIIVNNYNMAVEMFEKSLHDRNYDECILNYTIYSKLRRFAVYYTQRRCCNAMTNSIVFDHNGDMYPCHRFIGNSKFCIGNVCSVTDMKDVWRMFEKDLKINYDVTCKGCWLRNICAGGCYYDNYCGTNNCKTPNRVKCQIYVRIYERILKLYLSLSDEEKTLLKLK